MARRNCAPAAEPGAPKSGTPRKAAKKAATPGKKAHAGRPDVRVFIEQYVLDRNATRAAIAAGYSPQTAAQQGSRLLKNVKVRAELDSRQAAVIAKVQQETGITLERTLREIARIGYFDPRRLFDKDGRPLPITQLDDDTAAVIAGLDVMEEWQGSGEDRALVGYVKKWKLSDKKGALDMLMKHLGAYKADNDQAGEAAAKALSGLAVRFVEPPAR